VERAEVERRFRASRGRLMRLTRLRGVAEASAEDVVQETWLEAWKSLARLRDSDQFDAWLDGICRNVCRRLVASSAHVPQPASLGLPRLGDDGADVDAALGDVADTSLLDPLEELDRCDLTSLLDRALGYLPEPSREAMVLCYLEELPQREVAARLAVSIGALEERLRRARKLLRQTLNTTLRADAEAFGLTLDEAQEAGWRETRLWCPYCGKARLLGAFTRESPGGPLPGVYVRCPQAAGHPTIANAPRDQMLSLVRPVQGMTAFRPILKRMMTDVSAYYADGGARGWAPCRKCGAPTPLRWLPVERWEAAAAAYQIDVTCVRCGVSANEALPGLALALPEGRRFWQDHPHIRMLPAQAITFEGLPTLLTSFESLDERARLDVIAARDAFRILAVSNG
jgi:RNA polymerase sigma-70 factor (ECF subfamily)